MHIFTRTLPFFVICLSLSFSTRTESAPAIPQKTGQLTTTPANTQRGYIHIYSQSASMVIEKSNLMTPKIIDKTNHKEVTFEKSVNGNTVEITSKGLQPMVINPGSIVIQVPPNYDVDADGISSDVTIRGFSGNVLNVSTMSGNINSSTVAANRSKLKSMSGNIRVTSLISTGNHEFKSMSGDVVVMLGDGSSTKIFVQSEKSSASLNDKTAIATPLEDVVGSGAAMIRATTMSGDVDCRY